MAEALPENYDELNPFANNSITDLNLEDEFTDDESKIQSGGQLGTKSMITMRDEGVDEVDEDVKLWESIKDQCVDVQFPKMPEPPTLFRQRLLKNPQDVFGQNAWDNIEWDETMRQEAVTKVESNSKKHVPTDKKDLYENEANEFWNKFYGIHQNKFFKERNWLLKEFPELQRLAGQLEPSEIKLEEKRAQESFPGQNSEFRVLEVGCGNGSTVFPLLAANYDPELYVYCCDFSSSAVQVVKSNPEFAKKSRRCSPFVWDASSEDFSTIPFPPDSLNIIILIFVLSAISPEKFDRVIQNLAHFLKPGGLLLFRDYGVHDMVQLRFKEGRCISENFYVRGDGTRVYFFSEAEIENLFTSNGFEKQQLFVDRRLQVNRIRELKMYRIWIQGKFKKLMKENSIS